MRNFLYEGCEKSLLGSNAVNSTKQELNNVEGNILSGNSHFAKSWDSTFYLSATFHQCDQTKKGSRNLCVQSRS